MNTHAMISTIYSAFNQRDIDATLALMSADVSWPKASEGGRVVGKDAIRAYWSRQWLDFDPVVHALEIVDRPDGKARVKVHQIVKSLQGDLLSDTELWHIYTIRDGLIERMDILEADGNTEGPSTAFTHN